MISNASGVLAQFITPVKNHAAMVSVSYNFRKLFLAAGFDASLLTDQEVLSLEDQVFEYENEEDTDWLIDTLKDMVEGETELKFLASVNLAHKKYGLKRVNIIEYTSAIKAVKIYRSKIVKLGYSCALLTDNEILAFRPRIVEASRVNDDSVLIEVLNFLL